MVEKSKLLEITKGQQTSPYGVYVPTISRRRVHRDRKEGFGRRRNWWVTQRRVHPVCQNKTMEPNNRRKTDLKDDTRSGGVVGCWTSLLTDTL